MNKESCLHASFIKSPDLTVFGSVMYSSKHNDDLFEDGNAPGSLLVKNLQNFATMTLLSQLLHPPRVYIGCPSCWIGKVD